MALLTLLAIASPAHAQRVALLIANASYETGRLANPPRDLQVMAAALTDVGFRVQTVQDANQTQMRRAIRDFGEMAHGAEIALLYYSGHGTQVAGENYLIPLQAAIRKEADYEVEAVPVNAVMRQIVGARPKAAIVVLDACRDNPHAAATRGGSKGLSRMEAPAGSMIAFATAPGTTASDDGFYARALATNIRRKNVELIDVFRDTADEVLRASGGKQDPRISEMSIRERIYLAGREAAPSPAALAAPAQEPRPSAPTQRPTQVAADTRPTPTTGAPATRAVRLIKIATSSVKDDPIVQGLEKFGQLLESRSGGRLKVVVFPDGGFGTPSTNVDALRNGSLEMMSAWTASFAQRLPELGVFDLPFLFATENEVHAVLDGDFGKSLLTRLDAHGVVALGYYDTGFRHITTTTRPITRAADFAGLRLRMVPSQLDTDWVRATGAEPVRMPFNELMGALEQKRVDGQENPARIIQAARVYGAQKYMLRDGHQFGVQILAMSRKFWDGLSAEEQALVRSTAAESVREQREMTRAAAMTAADLLLRSGLQMTDLAPGELTKLREMVRPAVARYTSGFGAGAFGTVTAEIDKLRQR